MTGTGLDDFTVDLFLAAPAGIGGKARFDVDGLVRAVDAVIQGWVAGKLAVAEGDFLIGTFNKDPDWVSFATQSGLAGVLSEVEMDFLPRLESQALAIAARFPEVQVEAEEGARKIADRGNLARAARNRIARVAPVTPLRAPMREYTTAHTLLNIAKARVPPDAAAMEDARKQVALHFDAVTRAHAVLKGALDTIAAAANRFAANLRNVAVTRVTPAQRRTTAEYAAILAALKAAWSFQLATIPAPAPLPASRGQSLFQRAFAALRRGSRNDKKR